MPSIVAVDWSGAVHGSRRKIWLAEVRARRLVRLECGRDRPALAQELVECAASDPDLVVGLDFAFSFPRWFVEAQGCASAPDLWQLAARDGDAWLRMCAPPFWGRKGSRKPAPNAAQPLHRRTESDALPVRGVGPKSVFQIGGSGAVGTGSVRGMPWLAHLRARGFAIWPFDAPRKPFALEIYPRYLTGSINKTSAVERGLYMERNFATQDPALLRIAASSEDALDAAVSALRMSERAAAIERLSPAQDDTERLEGCLWRPIPRDG